MNKTAALFTGQGSQKAGMGKAVCEKYPQLKEIYDIGSGILGYDLAKLCFEGTVEELSGVAAQPAIMAVSIASYRAAELDGTTFDAVCGHSLGEYAAMAVSGMLSLEDGFTVIKARAEAMQRAAESAGGSMYAVMGISADKIAEVCNGIDGYVLPVNYNSSAQTVIAGEDNAAASVAEALSAQGAKTIRLNVAAAFHSKLMEPAAEEFYNSIKNVCFNAPNKAFFSNLYGRKLDDFSDMPALLRKHMVSPVLFTDELCAMQNDGIMKYVECGPAKVLTGFVKKTLADADAVFYTV